MGKQFGNPVMRFDLRRVGIPIQTQGLDEFTRQLRPVDFRVGNSVGVVVAYGAIDLAQNRYFDNLFPSTS